MSPETSLDKPRIVLAATGTAAVLVFALLPVIAGTMADHYQLDDVQTGLVASAYFSVYALIALTSSSWIRKLDWNLAKRIGYAGMLEINTLGVYHGLKHGPKHMNDGGSIINTASLAASFVFPGSGPYSASKAAVANLTTMAAAELATRQIRVNAVAPSFIRTPLAMDDIALFDKIGRRATNALRIAEPEEVAAVFHFLASDDASYINGQVIDVDGGMAIGMTEAMVELITQG